MPIEYIFPLLLIAVLLTIVATVFRSNIFEHLPRNWQGDATTFKVLGVILVILIVVFWSVGRDFFSGWLAASDGGKALGLEEASVSKWLWAIPVVVVLTIVAHLTPYKVISRGMDVTLAALALVWIYQTQSNNAAQVAADRALEISSSCITVDELGLKNSHVYMGTPKCVRIGKEDVKVLLHVVDSNHQIINNNPKYLSVHRAGVSSFWFVVNQKEFNKSGKRWVEIDFSAVR